jgi:hypothetical protein
MKSIVKAKSPVDEPVTAEVLQRAVARGRAARARESHATQLRYAAKARALEISFADGSAVLLPTKNYPELAALSANDMNALTLGYAGRAVCLESSDLQVSIAGLLAASQPLMSWAKTMVAAHNGSQLSTAKSAAARLNGKKGGRPRRLAAA